MSEDDLSLAKSLIVRTKNQRFEVYQFLRSIISNPRLELTDEQRRELYRVDNMIVADGRQTGRNDDSFR